MTTWLKVSLAELLRLERRPVKVEPTKLYQEIGIYCFGRGVFHKTARTGLEVGDKHLFLMKEHDFILQVTFAWEGAVAVISPSEDGMYGSTRYPTFRVDTSRCNPEFLLNYFKTHEGIQQLVRISPGSAGRNRVLSLKKIPEVMVPLPPLTEQQRIVARINEVSAQVREAQSLRRSASEDAETLSRAVIELEYQRLASRFGTTELAEACTTITDGDHNTPPFGESGIRFIFVGNVSSGQLHFRNSKWVSDDYFKTLRPHRVPQRGDLLYSAVGATLGIPAVVDSDESFCFQRHIAILKPNHERMNSRFGWYVLRALSVFEKAWSSTTGSAQPTIPLRAIRRLPIPLPPLADQRRTIFELDHLQEEIDKLKCLQDETATELDALLPSILSKAFQGQL
jgi:type I restriction enzyme S subunit